MKQLSNKTIQLMAKVHLANTLKNLSLENDKSDRTHDQIVDEGIFKKFNDEFHKQSERAIKKLGKEIGIDIPNLQNLSEVFELGFKYEDLIKNKTVKKPS